MSEQTNETPKPFGNPQGSNYKQQEISRLRAVALDEHESAKERLVAATKLLARFGPSRDNSSVIRQVIRQFLTDPDNDVRQRALKLKKKVLTALNLKQVAREELPDDSEIAPAIAEESSNTAIVAGTSASDVPRPSGLTPARIEEIIRGVSGTRAYESAPDLVSLPTTTQNLIIEAIVHERHSELGIEEIQSVVDSLERQRLGDRFPGLIEVAKRFLFEIKELLDALNRRDGAAA